MSQIRIKNIELLEGRYDQKQDFAHTIGVTPSYVAQLKRNGRPITEKTARKIEALLGLPKYWMDELHSLVEDVTLANDDEDVFIVPYQVNKAVETEQSKDMAETVKSSWLSEKGYKQQDLLTVNYRLSNMERIYFPGDKLIVHTAPVSEFENNKIYVFVDEHQEPVLWRVYNRRGGALLLSSENSSEYPDEIIAAKDIPTLEVLGVVVRLIRDEA
ncbi:S24 family peptidase [uncultured Paraglaciecola sp.]|uniref:S24 family peptidase n=1 Tax=uncultured Paraglaciecola sp. TaxID=1765024 RepID=UPI002619898C|nr:S24 family peptidase [uncultured Paraglaciecola sp.]